MPKPKKKDGNQATLETFVQRICDDVYHGRVLSAVQTILSLPNKNQVAYVTAVVCSRAFGTGYYEKFIDVLASYFEG